MPSLMMDRGMFWLLAMLAHECLLTYMVRFICKPAIAEISFSLLLSVPAHIRCCKSSAMQVKASVSGSPGKYLISSQNLLYVSERVSLYTPDFSPAAHIVPSWATSAPRINLTGHSARFRLIFTVFAGEAATPSEQRASPAPIKTKRINFDANIFISFKYCHKTHFALKSITFVLNTSCRKSHLIPDQPSRPPAFPPRLSFPEVLYSIPPIKTLLVINFTNKRRYF